MNILLNNEGVLKRNTSCVRVNGNSIVKAQLHKKAQSIDEIIKPYNEGHKADPHLFEMNQTI